MSVSPIHGVSTGEVDTLTITYDTTGLSSGSHTAQIDIWDTNASNPVETLIVDVEVGIPGDFDWDDDVDQEDFGHLQSCLSGPAVPPTFGCEDANLDGDLDVDQDDVAKFQLCISGPNVPGDPNCAY